MLVVLGVMLCGGLMWCVDSEIATGVMQAAALNLLSFSFLGPLGQLGLENHGCLVSARVTEDKENC